MEMIQLLVYLIAVQLVGWSVGRVGGLVGRLGRVGRVGWLVELDGW